MNMQISDLYPTENQRIIKQFKNNANINKDEVSQLLSKAMSDNKFDMIEQAEFFIKAGISKNDMELLASMGTDNTKDLVTGFLNEFNPGPTAEITNKLKVASTKFEDLI